MHPHASLILRQRGSEFARWYMASPRRRRALRWTLLAVGGLAVLVLLYLVVTPTGHYLVRAGWEEGKILVRRRSIVRMASDSRVSPATRKKLQLVLDARAFARDSLRLAVGRSFAT